MNIYSVMNVNNSGELCRVEIDECEINGYMDDNGDFGFCRT